MLHIFIRYYAPTARIVQTTLDHALESKFTHNFFIARIFRLRTDYLSHLFFHA